MHGTNMKINTMLLTFTYLFSNIMIDFQITYNRPVIWPVELLSIAQTILYTLVELFLYYFKSQGGTDILKPSTMIDICNIVPKDTKNKDTCFIIYYYVCTKRPECDYE
jgi:hypothetical protein